VGLPVEVQEQPRARNRAEPAARELTRAIQRGDPLQPRLGTTGRPHLHPNPRRAGGAGVVAVRRSGRRLRNLARPQHAPLTTRLDPHRAFDHLVALGLVWVHMRLGEDPARPSDDVVLDEFTRRVLRRLAKLDPSPACGASNTSPGFAIEHPYRVARGACTIAHGAAHHTYRLARRQ